MQMQTAAHSLRDLNGLGDGRHGLGAASLLAATATPPLGLLGLLLHVERRQDGEGLSHGRDAWGSRSFLEERSSVVVIQVLAEEVGIADEGAGTTSVPQRAAGGPRRIGTRGALARCGGGGVPRAAAEVAGEGAGWRRHLVDADGE